MIALKFKANKCDLLYDKTIFTLSFQLEFDEAIKSNDNCFSDCKQLGNYKGKLYMIISNLISAGKVMASSHLQSVSV